MARIDVPTLRCDRCETTTQDIQEMARYRKLTGMYDNACADTQVCVE